MKTTPRSLLKLPLALCVVSLALTGSSLHADPSGGDQNEPVDSQNDNNGPETPDGDQQNEQEDGQQGGVIHGQEQYGEDIVLTPTADAPANSSIEASIEASDDNGVAQGALKLSPQGLTDGTYDVSVTLKSDGSTVDLGTFDLVTPVVTNPPSEDGNDTEVIFGGTDHPFPTGFNPFDIATVTISDSTPTVLFTGDFTNPTDLVSGSINANVQILPSVATRAVNKVRGHAHLRAHAAAGKVSGLLEIHANGLAKNASLLLSVNGANLGQVRTTKGGALNLRKQTTPTRSMKPGRLPASLNLFSVKNLTVRTPLGKTIFTANF